MAQSKKLRFTIRVFRAHELIITLHSPKRNEDDAS